MKTINKKQFYTHLIAIGFITKFEFSKSYTSSLGTEYHYIAHIASSSRPTILSPSEYTSLQKHFEAHGDLYKWIGVGFPNRKDIDLYETCLFEYLKELDSAA